MPRKLLAGNKDPSNDLYLIVSWRSHRYQPFDI